MGAHLELEQLLQQVTVVEMAQEVFLRSFHIALSDIIDTTTEKAVIKGSRDLAVLLKPALSVVPETPFAVAMMIAVGGAFVFYKRTQKRTD